MVECDGNLQENDTGFQCKAGWESMWLNRTRGLRGGGDTGDGFEMQIRSDTEVKEVQERKRQPQ